jgi:uncharacterized protein YkwD
MRSRFLFAHVFACLGILLALVPASAGAEPLERALPQGRFFAQAVGGDGKTGFRITNEGGVPFWDEFQRLGGVDALGYPVGRRFQKDGFTVQPMQKGLLQWRPEVSRAWLANLFDELHQGGKDGWLQSARATPPPLPGSFDGGRDWNGVLKARLALLDANPAIKARYFAVEDPLTFYGLPTSTVVDNGNHYAIRLQRAVIQQWKVDVPWAKAGETTVANGGDVAKEAGLFPAESVKAESPDGSPVPVPSAPPAPASPLPAAAAQPAPAPAQPPAPAPAPAPSSAAQAALDRLNHYRAASGLPALRLDPALTKAAQAHAVYYRLNFGDGMSGMGLHAETSGKPGFTGADWSARARAAGYSGTVDENVGLVGKPHVVVDAWMDTINHRWNFMHPSAVAVGYGIDTERPIDVLNIGFDRGAASMGQPAVYPGPNQRGVPTKSGLWETPDAAPGVPRPVGYPITATFPLRASVSWGEAQLFDDANQALPIVTASKQWLRGFAIIPKSPLKSGATYRAVLRGTVDGKAFEYSWSFTTA